MACWCVSTPPPVSGVGRAVVTVTARRSSSATAYSCRPKTASSSSSRRVPRPIERSLGSPSFQQKTWNPPALAGRFPARPHGYRGRVFRAGGGRTWLRLWALGSRQNLRPSSRRSAQSPEPRAQSLRAQSPAPPGKRSAGPAGIVQACPKRRRSLTWSRPRSAAILSPTTRRFRSGPPRPWPPTPGSRSPPQPDNATGRVSAHPVLP